MSKKKGKMIEGSIAYNDEAIQLALSKMDIAPCINCGHPIQVDYTCGHCGSADGYDECVGYGYPNYTAKRS